MAITANPTSPLQSDVPSAEVLEVQRVAFVAENGLTVFSSREARLREALESPIPADAGPNYRWAVHTALQKGRPRLLGKNWAGLRATAQEFAKTYGNDLETVIGRGWVLSVIQALAQAKPGARQSFKLADAERALRMATERADAADIRQRRCAELEAEREKLWDAHNESLTRPEYDQLQGVLSRSIPPYSPDDYLDRVEAALRTLQKIVRRLEQPVVRGSSGRRGNEAARARSRERNAALRAEKGQAGKKQKN